MSINDIPNPESRASQSPQRFDVVVYGGTAGGVITAVTAAREGLSVALLELGARHERPHLKQIAHIVNTMRT